MQMANRNILSFSIIRDNSLQSAKLEVNYLISMAVTAMLQKPC